MVLSEAEKRDGLNAVEQIAALVHHASKQNLRVRAVGTGSSWSKLTNVRDILIGNAYFNFGLTNIPPLLCSLSSSHAV